MKDEATFMRQNCTENWNKLERSVRVVMISPARCKRDMDGSVSPNHIISKKIRAVHTDDDLWPYKNRKDHNRR